MFYFTGKLCYTLLLGDRKGQDTQFICYVENVVDRHKNQVCRSMLQIVWYPWYQRVLRKEQPTGQSKDTLSLNGNMDSQRHGSVATKPLRELEIKWLWSLHSSSSKCKPSFIFLTGFFHRAMTLILMRFNLRIFPLNHHDILFREIETHIKSKNTLLSPKS